MREQVSESRKRCKAMVDAGIYDPGSPDGIDFCVNYCPYDCCIVFESLGTAKQLKAEEKANFAKALRTHGVSVDDIALILGVRLKAAQKLLKK